MFLIADATLNCKKTNVESNLPTIHLIAINHLIRQKVKKKITIELNCLALGFALEEVCPRLNSFLLDDFAGLFNKDS